MASDSSQVELERGQGEFQGARDERLVWRSWRPAEPRGLVVLTHGFNEHGERYGPLAEVLARAGWALYGWDLRGHGRSGGRRGMVLDFDDYRRDLAAFLERVAAREPELPRFLYGHSMGGMISLRYLQEGGDGVLGAVVSAPPLEVAVPVSPVQRAAARIAARLAPRFTLSAPENGHRLSRDPAVVAAWKSDPLIHRKISGRLFLGIIDTGRSLLEAAPSIRAPLLLLQGDADEIVAPRVNLEFFERLGSRDKTLRVYKEGRHEPHNDLDRERVFGDVTAWLEARLPGPDRAGNLLEIEESKAGARTLSREGDHP